MSSQSMRAVLVRDGAGPAENLYIGDASRPSPGPGQILVKVKTFGLNRMDIIQRDGNYPIPAGASKILGVEFGGIVEELGDPPADGDQSGEGKALRDALKRWKKGDEVFGLAYGVSCINTVLFLAQRDTEVIRSGRLRGVHRLPSHSPYRETQPFIVRGSNEHTRELAHGYIS